MAKEDQKRLAENCRLKHQTPPLLLLPNAWDAMSARIFEAAGFNAIATTSGGVAWALGFPDGEKAPWHEVVAATERIVRTVSVPVTAEIEAGYGETPDQVARSVSEIIRIGAVGINLEDGTPHPERPIRSVEDAVERIRAARLPGPRMCPWSSMQGLIFISNMLAMTRLALPRPCGEVRLTWPRVPIASFRSAWPISKPSVNRGGTQNPDQHRGQSWHAERRAARAAGCGARQHGLRPFASCHVVDAEDRAGASRKRRIRCA
jgi:hypothetical protein